MEKENKKSKTGLIILVIIILLILFAVWFFFLRDPVVTIDVPASNKIKRAETD